MGLDDLGDVCEGCVDVAGSLWSYGGGEDDDLEAEPECRWVDDRSVAADGAIGFEVADPSLAARDAEVHPVGKVGEGKSAVNLKLSNNFAVRRIHIAESSAAGAHLGKRGEQFADELA